jgi:hypothetical protein
MRLATLHEPSGVVQGSPAHLAHAPSFQAGAFDRPRRRIGSLDSPNRTQWPPHPLRFRMALPLKPKAKPTVGAAAGLCGQPNPDDAKGDAKSRTADHDAVRPSALYQECPQGAFGGSLILATRARCAQSRRKQKTEWRTIRHPAFHNVPTVYRVFPIPWMGKKVRAAHARGKVACTSSTAKSCGVMPRPCIS